MEPSKQKIKNKVVIIGIMGFLSFCGLEGTTFITKCFDKSSNINGICVKDFLQNADPTEKLIYNLSIAGGIFFGLITLYLFYKIKKDPEVMTFLTMKLTPEEKEKRRKQTIEGF